LLQLHFQAEDSMKDGPFLLQRTPFLILVPGNKAMNIYLLLSKT